MADVLIEALTEHNNDLIAALKSIVSAEVRVVLDGTEIVGLNLDDTKITDEALEKLVSLDKLRWLGLARTGVSSDGVSSLKKTLPACTILADVAK